MAFEFTTARRIIFGPGRLAEAGSLSAEFGRQALVACGLDLDRARPLLTYLNQAGVSYTLFPVTGEPGVTDVLRGVELARQEKVDVVVGFGGGSSMDTAKAIAALANNPGDPYDYLEVVGRGQPIQAPSIPVIAIPTTAGTGAEVTRNAVLGVPDQQVKVSLRSPQMLPRVALVDPELTYSLPPDVTASTGLDALTQLIEPFVSNAANPITDGFCREGIRRAARSLRKAYEQGENANAREDMSLAGLLGGLALANARLGAVHGFAGPIGGMFAAPHGIVCAALLPVVMDVNLQVLLHQSPGHPVLERFTEVAAILTGKAQARPQEAVAWLENLTRDLNVPHLAAYGVSPSDFPALVEKASRASSMRGNPIILSPEELTQILARAV